LKGGTFFGDRLIKERSEIIRQRKICWRCA
jgi:hypothetical protein